MSKWKCGICNSEFDNFQAQGFGGTIYCPLCYFKELYRRTKLEIDRLNNIIDGLEKYINETKLKEFENVYGKRYSKTFTQAEVIVCNMILDKLKELKENK